VLDWFHLYLTRISLFVRSLLRCVHSQQLYILENLEDIKHENLFDLTKAKSKPSIQYDNVWDSGPAEVDRLDS
jgi:hypothetical protein